MKNLLLGLLLLVSASRAVDTLSIPTDFNTVTSGTRANLSSNFTSIGTWAGKIRDTVAQVTGRISGFSGTMLVSSLSNLRLKLDADNSETARLLVEAGNGDSLFRVSEDTTARFFRHLTVDSNLTVGKNLSVTGTTGLTGTLTGAAANFSGAVSTGALSATTGAFSSTLGVTGTQTNTGSLVVNGIAGSVHQLRTAIAATGVVKVADAGTFGNTNNPRIEFLFDEANKETIQRMTGSASPLIWRFQNSAATDLLTLANGGAVTVPGTLGLTGLLTATAGVSVPDGAGLVSTISASTRALIARSGTTLNIGENGGWTGVSYRTTSGTHDFTIGGTSRFTVAAGGGTVDGGLVISGTGSAADAKMYVTSADGLSLRGKAGSSYDFAINNPAGNPILRNPTGTANLEAPGKITGSDTVAALLGFRAGNTAASNTILYRSAADMWTTPDSLTVSGRLAVGDSISTGGNEKFAYDEGSFTVTLTGCTTSPTGTAYYTRVGKNVTVRLPFVEATSNSVSATLTGFPAALTPTHDAYVSITVMNNGVNAASAAKLSGTTLTLWPGVAPTAPFTTSGTKGIDNDGTTFSYTLQ